jgi:hypothetical protein
MILYFMSVLSGPVTKVKIFWSDPRGPISDLGSRIFFVHYILKLISKK